VEERVTIIYQDDLAGVDWQLLKTDLITDRFDNGRSPEQLEQSFRNSFAVCIAWLDSRVIGTARVLSDGVCNAYLVDVWTKSAFRRQGIARKMIERLCNRLYGQHLYLQADAALTDFYRRIGFVEQPVGMSRVIGQWLVEED
jgi:ribosomal protein S18 acetylase RimI-like enzyme